MTVTDRRNRLYPFHLLPLTHSHFLGRNITASVSLPDMSLELTFLHQVGQNMVLPLVPSLQKEACMAQKETRRVAELAGTEEFWLSESTGDSVR